MKRTRDDLITKIKTARDEAYKSLASKRYDYWRAIATADTYDETLGMFEHEIEHEISGLAGDADREFENARDGDVTEMTLAMADGRRDALNTVLDYMGKKEAR